MAQAQQGVLDRIFARFQSKRGTQQNQQTPREIDDPANPGKRIPNPQYKEPTQGTQSDDPMSLYAGLFDAPSGQSAKQAPKFALGRDKITEAAGRINFMEGMPKELTDALATPDGLTAENITALIQHAGRTAYSRAIEHNTQLTDHFVNARMQHENEQLPQHIRTHMAKSKARPAGMDDPVIREHLDFISGRIADRFPDATEDEVAEMSQEYFTQFARKLNPDAFTQQDGTGNNRGGGGEPASDVQDFDSYLQGTKNLEQARQPVQQQQQRQGSGQGQGS